MYKITTFESKSTKGKSPISPFEDKFSFIFETINTDNEFLMFQTLATNFILNIPLNLDVPTKLRRRKEDLDQYYQDTVNYLIIDCDHVHSEKHQKKILEYFKQYKCIIGESRSHNGIDNFNLKGFLFCDLPMNMLKFAVQNIHEDLMDFCDFDVSVSRKASLNAPIGKVKIIFDNTKCERVLVQSDIDVRVPGKIFNIPTQFEVGDTSQLEADSIDELCLKFFQNMGFVAFKNNTDNSISFKHPTEQKTPGGYFWYRDSPYIMHHFNASKNINIFDEIRKLPQAKDLLSKDLNYQKCLESINPNAKVITVNQKFLKITDELKQSVSKFLEQNDGMFEIRSPMGTCKSTVISYIINEACSQDMRILIITNRISVAEDFNLKYGLKIYNKDKYQIGDSLICQYDSLWKYNIKYFDLIILDEFISLILHSRNTINNSAINCGKFFASFNKKVVIADAFLSGFENEMFQNKKHNVWYLNNEYRDSTLLYEYSNFNYFVMTLLKKAKTSKCTVSCTSLSMISALQILLHKYNIRVCTLIAETPSATKSLIYKQFSQETNDKWDVLIYSPTLTVGVSNLNNVDYHFHYDSSMTSDVISSIQMIKRTRKAKEIHFYIKPRINFVKTSYEEVKDDYITNIGHNAENNYLFEMNVYGEPRLSSIGKKAVSIDTFKNILEFNHKQAFEYFLKYHFISDPIKIDLTYESNVLLKYIKENRENQQQKEKAELDQYLMLNDIERTAILEKIECSNIMENISNIDNELLECDPETKKDILLCGLKDKSFIKKCKFFKLFIQRNNVPDEYLKNLISKAIMDNNQEVLEFLNKLLNYKGKISSEYEIKDVDSKLKYFISKCGFRIYRSDLKRIGHRYYEIDRTINKYYSFIKC